MKYTLVAACLAGLSAPAICAEPQINGFANFIGGMTLDDNETVYGYDDNISFSPATLFGLQVRTDINDRLSATAQIVGRGSEDFDLDFEWAYMSYAINDNTNISAGRLRLPLFKYSAYLDVGYAYHWLTPPQSVYNVDYNNIDGIRVDYQNYMGEWEYNLQFTAGVVETDTVIAGAPAELSIDNVVTASFDVTRDWFSARALYGMGKVTARNNDFGQFIAGLRQFSAVIPNTADVASNLEADDDSGRFIEVAVDIDKYDWFVGAEFTRVEVDNTAIAVNDAWYVTAGLRLGQFTPHITYEEEEADNGDQLGYISGLPAAIASGDAVTDGTWAVLYQSAQGIVAAQKAKTSAVTVGVRYDYEPGLALKTDITWYSDDLNAARDATLLRFGVNYTF
ncbi:topoisomerase IV [Alteromonas sp. CYL-A6]|uniref:topoisomerase IV n=1 Tax=Alteromonas nitratireducens TaxID=3390813 RepID=UPI0034B2E04F